MTVAEVVKKMVEYSKGDLHENYYLNSFCTLTYFDRPKFKSILFFFLL